MNSPTKKNAAKPLAKNEVAIYDYRFPAWARVMLTMIIFSLFPMAYGVKFDSTLMVLFGFLWGTLGVAGQVRHSLVRPFATIDSAIRYLEDLKREEEVE